MRSRICRSLRKKAVKLMIFMFISVGEMIQFGYYFSMGVETTKLSSEKNSGCLGYFRGWHLTHWNRFIICHYEDHSLPTSITPWLVDLQLPHLLKSFLKLPGSIGGGFFKMFEWNFCLYISFGVKKTNPTWAKSFMSGYRRKSTHWKNKEHFTVFWKM